MTALKLMIMPITRMKKVNRPHPYGRSVGDTLEESGGWREDSKNSPTEKRTRRQTHEVPDRTTSRMVDRRDSLKNPETQMQGENNKSEHYMRSEEKNQQRKRKFEANEERGEEKGNLNEHEKAK